MYEELKYWYLRDHKLFWTLNGSQLKQLCIITGFKKAKKGEIIYFSSSELPRVFLLKKGNIKIVDFFFVDCKTICPKMSSQLERVQKKIQTVKNVVILSHTVNPEQDSVSVLKRYAEEHGAIQNKWHFLTGDKKELYKIAREGYLVNALQGDGGPDDFIHTELFVLVDQNNRIRGFYDGTSAGAVDTLIDELKVLLKEEIAGPKKSRK